jgi:cytochrome bd-type quinol oxidase subunit 2
VEHSDASGSSAAAGGARRLAWVVAAAAFAVLLWGGYVEHWRWTGFDGNDRLWDWLNLLLLPVAIAALPVWLGEGYRLDSRGRRVALAALVAFGALVVAGYLVPLVWTGFVGNTLWDWLGLLVLPVVVTVAALWSDIRAELRLHHRLLIAAGLVGFAVAVLGGYLGHWRWTGFRGNTLWDWLELLILPVLVPTVLLPAALAFLGEREEGGEAGPRRQDAPRWRTGLAVIGAVAAGGLVAVIALAQHPSAHSAGTTARGGCEPAGSATVVAGPGGRVFRVGPGFYACRAGDHPVALGLARADGGPVQFAIAQSGVVFADDRCGAPNACTTDVKVLRLGIDARPGARLSVRGSGGAVALYAGPHGVLAVTVRGACVSGGSCGPARLFVRDAGGNRVVASGASLDPASLAGAGETVYWREGGQARSLALVAP